MIAVNTGAAAVPTTTTIAVTGMTCSHCVAAVTEEVSRLEAVVGVTVDLVSGSVTVESNGPLDPAELVAAIDEAGYEVAS
jgi:copper chaperone